MSVLSVELLLDLGSVKIGETGKPFSNWLAVSIDAIVFIG